MSCFETLWESEAILQNYYKDQCLVKQKHNSSKICKSFYLGIYSLFCIFDSDYKVFQIFMLAS